MWQHCWHVTHQTSASPLAYWLWLLVFSGLYYRNLAEKAVITFLLTCHTHTRLWLTSPICRASLHLLTFSRNLLVAASSSALSSASPGPGGLVTEGPMGVSGPGSVMVITDHDVTISLIPHRPHSSLPALLRMKDDSVFKEKTRYMISLFYSTPKSTFYQFSFYVSLA